MADKDKYGIPPGGNNGAWAAHKLGGINYTLPWKELMAAIALAGWPQELWGMAGAVCAAESGRNPFIYNTYKMGHFGLFQISRAAWPEFFAESKNGGMDWVSPIRNAEQGYHIYKLQGWGAWEGKTNGGYLAHYPAAMTAAADLQRATQVHGGDEKGYWTSLISQKTWGYVLKALNVSAADIANAANQSLANALGDAAGAVGQGTVDSGSAVAASVGEMAQVVTGMWEALTTPALWMRIGYGVLGIGLVAGGLFLVIRSSPGVQKTAASVAGAAKKGVVP